MKKSLAMVLLAFAPTFANAAFTFDDGATGATLLGTFPTFGIISGDINVAGTALYTDIAAYDTKITFAWTYVTGDEDGAAFDPAGFVNNGVFTQLSPANGYLPAAGTSTFNVSAGSLFGFYVTTTDGAAGPAVAGFHVTGYTVSAVPEPESYAMMLAGIGLIGFVVRSRSQYAA